MGFERYRKPQAQGRRSLAPTVAIGKAQLLLNRNAIQLIGPDQQVVFLEFDPGTNTMGFWFFKDEQDPKVLDDFRAIHKITHIPIRGSGKRIQMR